jgi:hypothetical protein
VLCSVREFKLFLGILQSLKTNLSPFKSFGQAPKGRSFRCDHGFMFGAAPRQAAQSSEQWRQLAVGILSFSKALVPSLDPNSPNVTAQASKILCCNRHLWM